MLITHKLVHLGAVVLVTPLDDDALDAMAERRDWVFTHAEYLDALDTRHAAIAADYRKIV